VDSSSKASQRAFTRISAQWKYLSKQFSIQGVPTYIIVDKEGAVIQKHTGFPGVDTVKKELMKALEK